SFAIKRGVRQGCPLSMILYVLSQEPLYLAIKHTKQIKPFDLPCRPTKLLGFADDTTIFVKNELSIWYLFGILEYFERASGIKLNMTKTKIFGFGEWRGRKIWPIPNVKSEMYSINILGITYSHDLDDSVEKSWSNILIKIKQKIGLMSSRYFTLYQRAIVINTTILSKVWYTAHTYPLPTKYSKLINKEIFPFLWLAKYNPIKRDIVYQSTHTGGLNVFNVFHKSHTILTATFIKQFLNSLENDSIMKYYCALRLNPIFNIMDTPTNVSYQCPKYFENIIALVKQNIHVPKFPNITSLDIYSISLPKTLPTVSQNRNINWKRSWKHLNFKFINIRAREIAFKLMHNILTTKMRLYQIKRSDSPLCKICKVNEDIKHMFIDCVKVRTLFCYFEKAIKRVCNISNININTLHLDFKLGCKQDTNTAILLT
ncbi:unnamed protein product, partial [Meganyctiphanes norvegica]